MLRRGIRGKFVRNLLAGQTAVRRAPRKIFALACLPALALSLAGCGGGASSFSAISDKVGSVGGYLSGPTGEALQVPLPMGSLVRDRLLASLARGEGGLDFAAMSRRAREDAGLPD